jgi:hypothetical protein
MPDDPDPETSLSKPGPPTDTEHPTGEEQAAKNADNDPLA